MTMILRSFAWCLAAAVTFATLGPARLRPHLFHLGQDGEHALAFILLGLAFGAAYPRQRLFVAINAVAGTGVLELLQFMAPGRHARLEDFIVDALSACAGFAMVAIWQTARTRSQLSNSGAV